MTWLDRLYLGIYETILLANSSKKNFQLTAMAVSVDRRLWPSQWEEIDSKVSLFPSAKVEPPQHHQSVLASPNKTFDSKTIMIYMQIQHVIHLINIVNVWRQTHTMRYSHWMFVDTIGCLFTLAALWFIVANDKTFENSIAIVCQTDCWLEIKAIGFVNAWKPASWRYIPLKAQMHDGHHVDNVMWPTSDTVGCHGIH